MRRKKTMRILPRCFSGSSYLRLAPRLFFEQGKALLARAGRPLILAAVVTAAGCGPVGDDEVAKTAPSDNAASSEALLEFGAQVLEEPSINLEDTVAPAASCTVSVDNRSQLMVTALSVVNDTVRTNWTGGLLNNPSDGAWHFGRLMNDMAGPNNPSDFVRSWLAQWQATVVVNGQAVPARPNVVPMIINRWPKLSNGKLDLTKAPFRLLAIANRFDLRSPGNAGETRFVFGLVASADPEVPTTAFTVILEYKMLAPAAADVKKWAHLWRGLRSVPFGSESYKGRLQDITDRSSVRGVGIGRPNESAVSQVRTNEIALGASWELREFQLTTAGQLRMAPVALTPVNSATQTLNNTTVLAQFMTLNAAAIKAQTQQVPLSFQSKPFRGAAVINASNFWVAPGISDSLLRHRFSISTCDGCHGEDTRTTFMHVDTRAKNEESGLSAFLTGTTVGDPVTGADRTFNELSRRNVHLKAFLCANP